MIRVLTDEESAAQTHYYFTEKVPREKIDEIPRIQVLDWMASHGWSKDSTYHLADIYSYGEDPLCPRLYRFYDESMAAHKMFTSHALQTLMDVHGMSLQQLLDEIRAVPI